MICSARRLILAAVTALAAWAAPAAAQSAGSFDPHEYEDTPAAAVRVMHDFARCTIRRRRWPALRFLEAEPGSEEAGRLMMAAIDPSCLTRAASLSLSGPLARGILYEAVYRRDHRRPPDPAIGSVPRLAYPDPAPEASRLQHVRAALFRLGECVARAAPGEAHALVMTDPAGDEEAGAIAELTPRFAACLPAGERSVFSAPVLRGALAEALYRLRAAQGR